MPPRIPAEEIARRRALLRDIAIAALDKLGPMIAQTMPTWSEPELRRMLADAIDGKTKARMTGQRRLAFYARMTLVRAESAAAIGAAEHNVHPEDVLKRGAL